MAKKLNALFQSFNCFDALFENAKQNCVLLMDVQGIIRDINSAFTVAFGYTDDEIIGKYTNILFTKEDQQKELPERELATVLQTGEAKDNNYLVHKDGTITWVTGESMLIKNDKGDVSILKVIMDIHAQKTSEDLLRTMNEFNESILRAIEDVVIVLNTGLKIIKANKAFSKLFTVTNEVVNMDFAKLIEPYDTKGDLQNKLLSTLATRKGFTNKELEIETITGEKRVFDISCTPMEDNTNILLVVHDITIQRYSDRQREDIIGFVAHELRNPLANIVLCNELLDETIKEKNVDAARDLVARSKNNVMRLNKMIAELYDATKVGSGNMQLEISEFNFEDMVKEAVETIEILQPDYKIIVTGKADILVSGDRYRLIQVVTNYLSNGIKYSKGSTEVEFSMQNDERNVTVSVKDKGLGISKEQLPYIFNRFFRAEKTKNLEGVGLGLYLCRQIIKAHNGNVWAESEEGKGSTFYFSIPI
ncbi:MAG TPA: PAS domain-containing sensor histidine kinase [Chitinophagaceae bacterium]|nr:PAS domain-containing sensor histidine kinase [Chitinophagaceae bacterium]